MVTQELLNYIGRQLQQGKKPEEIKTSLTQNNWAAQDIEAAFQQIQTTQPPIQATQTPQGSNNTKAIIVILLLLFFYPIGIIFMWVWMKRWSKWLKIILTLGLLIIPLIAVILAIVLVAINPSRQLSASIQVQRQSDVTAIIKSLRTYKTEHFGQLPPGITSNPAEISKHGADICSAIVPTYLSALPVDPALNKSPITNCSQSYNTGYIIGLDESGKIIVQTAFPGTTPQ
jgi:type IV pilus assembly protein PilA